MVNLHLRVYELMHGCIDMPLINDYKETVSLLCNICMDTDNRKPKVYFLICLEQ